MEDEPGGALDGIRILDLTTGIAGPLGILMLAEQGADVVKIEPPGGDPLRSMPGSVVWHRSRRSVEIDLGTQEGREVLLGLIERADVLAESFAPGTLARFGLGYEDLRERFPRLVFASVPAYPAASRHAGRPGYDACVQAVSGLQYEQPGWRDGPVFLHFPAPSMAACFLFSIGIATALCARETTGEGQLVETSLYQGALAYTTMLWHEVPAAGPAHHALLGKTNPPGVHQSSIYECADGWAHAATMNGLTPKRSLHEVAGLDAPDMAAIWRATPAEREAMDVSVRDAVRSLGRDVFVAGMHDADLGAEAIVPMYEAYSHPQLVANGMVVDVEDPEIGPTTQIGVPVSLSRTPGAVRGPRPAAGADNAQMPDLGWSLVDEPVGSHAGSEPDARRSAQEHAPRAALEHVVVLDLGQYLAGPYGPMILSDLGADVIKVEPVTGDAMRLAPAPFIGCQRGKRSLAVDLRKPEGLEVVHSLVARADVVHHNMTKGTAARLGVDEETLRRIKPDLVYCNTYAYGEDGPLSHSGGLDPLYQASCGLEYEAGPVQAGNAPLYIRMGMCDTGNALLSVLGVVVALYRRGAGGGGQSVTTSLLNAGAVFSSDVYLVGDGPVGYPRLDKDQTGLGPLYRLYRTFDGWIQIAAVRSGGFEAMCRVLGVEDLPADPRFSTAQARQRNRDELEATLAPVFAARTSQQLHLALDAAGVANEIPVDTVGGESVLHDDENIELGLVVAYEHEIFGTMRQFGQLIDLSETPGRIAGPPPMVGEHSREVLEWAGLPADEIDRLKRDGIVYWPEDGVDYPWSC